MSLNTAPWKSWGEFCDITGRECLWGEKLGKLLVQNRVLPSRKVLEVGCGTGEFLHTLKQFTENIVGIDPADYRVYTDFDYKQIPIENYDEDSPDVIIFKQVFHLLTDPYKLIQKYPNATIVLLQQAPTKKEAMNNPLIVPSLNRINLNRLGYATFQLEDNLQLRLSRKMYRKMILDGYTSDLAKMSVLERLYVWEIKKKEYNGVFDDKLTIIIATPTKNT